MNANPGELIKALVKLGVRHETIAHSLGLLPHVLRRYFARELLAAASEAELDALAAARQHSAALFRLKFQQPRPPKPNESTPFNPGPPPKIVVVNNEGEPLYPG